MSTGNALLTELGLDQPERLNLGLRRAEPLVATFMRELEPADLVTAQEVGIDEGNGPKLKSLRQGHHQLARLLAQGLKVQEVSDITGHSATRISMLKSDPTFAELLEHYTNMEAEAYSLSRADMRERLAGLGFDAIETLHEKLLEEPDTFDAKTLLLIVEATSDRTGHGKTSTVNTTHVHELSEQSLAAIRLSGGSARPTETDRATLVSLAARQTALVHPDAQAAQGGGGEGSSLREESIEGTAVDVTRPDSLSPVDRVLGGREEGLRGAGSLHRVPAVDPAVRDEADRQDGRPYADGGALQAALGEDLFETSEVLDGLQVGDGGNSEAPVP